MIVFGRQPLIGWTAKSAEERSQYGPQTRKASGPMFRTEYCWAFHRPFEVFLPAAEPELLRCNSLRPLCVPPPPFSTAGLGFLATHPDIRSNRSLCLRQSQPLPSGELLHSFLRGSRQRAARRPCKGASCSCTCLV